VVGGRGGGEMFATAEREKTEEGEE